MPHFHLHDEAVVDALVAARKHLARDPALGGGKLTMLPFIIKVMRHALLVITSCGTRCPHGHLNTEQGAKDIACLLLPGTFVAQRPRAASRACAPMLSPCHLPLQAVSLTLSEHPLLNASLSADQTSITLRGAHNVGVAMATSAGLVVPNIKQASTRLELMRRTPAHAPPAAEGEHSVLALAARACGAAAGAAAERGAGRA